MANAEKKTTIIWRISDGRPGHDNQSAGLVQAISTRTNISCHEFNADNFRFPLFNYPVGRYPPGDAMTPPDLIIGAGHHTHLSLLAAKRAHGGKSVVIMQPSLPLFLFDHCLIPEHDNPPARNNIFLTEGALNSIQPSTAHQKNQGLILIGGASRHYYWHEESLLEQIKTLLAATPDVHWQVSDSPRTPQSTRSQLSALTAKNVTYAFYKQTSPGWVAKQLASSGQTWITQDSISMIYESLTAGTATGLLTLPVKKQSKVVRSIAALRKKYNILIFDEWQAGTLLQKPQNYLHEADRCAHYLLETLNSVRL